MQNNDVPVVPCFWRWKCISPRGFTENKPGLPVRSAKNKRGCSGDFSQAVFKIQVWFLTGNILRAEKEAKSATKKERVGLLHVRSACRAWTRRAQTHRSLRHWEHHREGASQAHLPRETERERACELVFDWPYCKNHKKWPVPEHGGSATHYDGIIKERRWSVKGVVFSGLSNEPIYIPVVVAIFFSDWGLKI